MIFLSCPHRACNAASIPSVKAMFFKGSIEEHWVTMHLGSCHMQCTCMELDFQNWAVPVQHRAVWKTWPKEKKSVLVLLSLLLPYCSYFFKVCPHTCCQLLSVSGVTKSIYKYISESHKSPSYSAKGWRRAATHQQHWRALKLILSCKEERRQCIQHRHKGQASARGSTGSQMKQKKTMKTMRWKSWWETMQGYQLCNHWWEQWLWTLMCYWPRAKYTSCTWQPPALLKDKTMQSSSTSVGWFSVSVSNKNLDKW